MHDDDNGMILTAHSVGEATRPSWFHQAVVGKELRWQLTPGRLSFFMGWEAHCTQSGPAAGGGAPPAAAAAAARRREYQTYYYDPAAERLALELCADDAGVQRVVAALHMNGAS